MQSRYRLWIIYVAALSLPFGVWLIYSEIKSPGYCPPYPMIGVPTCYLVTTFFLLVLVSQLVKHRMISSLMFQVGAIAGIATAIWFSVNHVLGNLQCPVLFGIPLCFAAFATFLALITLHQLRCIDEDRCSVDG